MSHTLLLADDSLAIQRVVELTFASEDVRVIAVGDGQQAIERLMAERPDIVLADIAMPLVDGYAVAEFVRSTPSIRDIPVLLLAGAFDVVEESRLGASGARGVLVKPFEPHVVISRVKELLGLGGSAEPASSSDNARLVTPTEPPRPPRTLSVASVASVAPAAAQPTSATDSDREGRASAAVADRRLTQASELPGPVSAAAGMAGHATAGTTAPPAAPFDADVTASLVDRIASRVVEQLGERLRAQVSEMVLTMSERLVREEIARIRDEAGQVPAHPPDDAERDS